MPFLSNFLFERQKIKKRDTELPSADSLLKCQELTLAFILKGEHCSNPVTWATTCCPGFCRSRKLRSQQAQTSHWNQGCYRVWDTAISTVWLAVCSPWLLESPGTCLGSFIFKLIVCTVLVSSCLGTNQDLSALTFHFPVSKSSCFLPVHTLFGFHYCGETAGNGQEKTWGQRWAAGLSGGHQGLGSIGDGRWRTTSWVLELNSGQPRTSGARMCCCYCCVLFIW